MPYIYPKKQAPIVTYSPKQPPRAGAVAESPPPTNPPPAPTRSSPGFNPMNYYNPSMQNQPAYTLTGQGQYSVPNPNFPTGPAYGPLSSGYVPNPGFDTPETTNSYQNFMAGAAGATPNWMEDPNMNGTNAGAPGTSPAPAGGGGGSLDTILQNEKTKAAAAESERLAEIQREWDRIAPLAQQYGIDQQRLIDVYMDPSNPAAKSDFRSALINARMDDAWGAEATKAFGRPPNQVEWDEHWRAMNVGGRDPLEGHPAAIQNLQAAADADKQKTQSSAFDAYKAWAASQG